MKQLLHVLVLGSVLGSLASPAVAGEPAPRAIDSFVNLVLGACMAAQGGKAVVAEPIDPVAVGTPVAADNDDPRLGPDSLQLPTTDGVVYHDGGAESCQVHGDGIDAQAALEQVREALRASGLPVMPFSDGVITDSAGESRRTAVWGVMVSPRAETLPLVTISYGVDTPAALTGEVRAGKVE